MNNLQDIHKALVVGLGFRTGLAAANFLARKGCAVTVSDNKSREDLAEVIDKLDKGITVLAGEQTPSILDEGFDLVVLSPGVPRVIPLIAEAEKRGVPVISEIELAYRYDSGKIIAITGTDGKSTTTSLAGHILQEIGITTFLGGNIGIPYISSVEKTGKGSAMVLELSSFQLETIDRFRPHVAAMLNITPDHLDRYRDMDDYRAAKLHISRNQTEDDAFIYNADDKKIVEILDTIRARKLGFSLSDSNADAYYDNNRIFVRQNNVPVEFLDTRRLRIIGLHNVQNVMAALLMVLELLPLLGKTVTSEQIATACYSFKGLPHRMEDLGEFQGRRFINDSKATTVGAVEMALKGLDTGVILVLGGRTKGDDYSRLAKSLQGRVKTLVLIGESTRDFSKIFSDFRRVAADSLDDALVASMKESGEGDVILLSPACASFDMFSSYEDRGRQFRESFKKLQEGKLQWT